MNKPKTKDLQKNVHVANKRVTLEVEKLLNKNPIKIPGFGLKKEFRQIFDKPSVKA